MDKPSLGKCGIAVSILLAAGVTFAALGALAPAEAQQRFVTIGTGGVTGVYYAAGGAWTSSTPCTTMSTASTFTTRSTWAQGRSSAPMRWSRGCPTGACATSPSGTSPR